MECLVSTVLNEWYLFTGALACGLAAGTLLLSSLAVILLSSLVTKILSAVVVGGGEDRGDSSAGLVTSLSALAVILLPLLTRSMLLSVVEVVSVLHGFYLTYIIKFT